jgi:hypothetical protein
MCTLRSRRSQTRGARAQTRGTHCSITQPSPRLSSRIGYPEAIRELSRIGYPEAIGARDLHALLLSSLSALDESRVRASICSAPCARACAALAPPPIPIPDRLSGGYPRAIEDRLSGSYRRARLAHSSPVFLARSMSHMRLHAPRRARRSRSRHPRCLSRIGYPAAIRRSISHCTRLLLFSLQAAAKSRF